MNRYLCILTMCLAVVVSGCGTENPFSRGPETEDDATNNPVAGENVSFSSDVVPALNSCVSCHRSGAGGWTYDGGAGAYASVLEVVDRNDPAGSLLLVKATGGGGHGGGTLFSSSSNQYDAILRWIEQGAGDN